MSGLAPIVVRGVEYDDLGYCRTPNGDLYGDGPVLHTVYCRYAGGRHTATSGDGCVRPGRDGPAIDDASNAPLVYEATFTSLKKTFEAAAKDRSSRQGRVVCPDGRREPAWVAHERAVMRAAVDRLRAVAGREPVGDGEFARAEERACGHVDYGIKFPLYCADLVVD